MWHSNVFCKKDTSHGNREMREKRRKKMKTDVVKITESLIRTIIVIALSVTMVLAVTACVPGEESPSEEVGVLEQEEAVMVAEETAEAAPFSLTIDKDVYMPGETITVVYTASDEASEGAFIGIVAMVEDAVVTDAPVYLTTQELAGVVNGSIELAAPADPGFYELHLVDGDYVISIVPFSVAEAM